MIEKKQYGAPEVYSISKAKDSKRQLFERPVLRTADGGFHRTTGKLCIEFTSLPSVEFSDQISRQQPLL